MPFWRLTHCDTTRRLEAQRPLRKLHIVTSQVLLAGGGNSNGIAKLLGGLRKLFANDQGADLGTVVEAISGGIKECHDAANAERKLEGGSPLPLWVYLAGLGTEGTPQIEYLEQKPTGFGSATFTNAYGCMSVNSAAATIAAQKRYRRLAKARQQVALDQWAIESIDDHAKLFPGQVGNPADIGYVLPSGSTIMLGSIKLPVPGFSLKVVSLP